MNYPIDYTPKAEEHLVSVLKNLDQPYLVFGLKGGGCAGFEYFWQPADKEMVEQNGSELDVHIPLKENKTLIVDGFSLEYLSGSTIDYTVSIEGSMLVVNNPLAQSSCGCGTSVNFGM